MNVSFKTRGFEEVQRKLKDLPYGAKKIVLPAISEYLIGDDSHGLKHYPPVTTQEYIKNGGERSYDLSNGWQVQGGVYNEKIVNDVDYAVYVPPMWGPGGYINYNWRPWLTVINDNMAGALRHANAELKKWLEGW